MLAVHIVTALDPTSFQRDLNDALATEGRRVERISYQTCPNDQTTYALFSAAIEYTDARDAPHYAQGDRNG